MLLFGLVWWGEAKLCYLLELVDLIYVEWLSSEMVSRLLRKKNTSRGPEV